jgi:hypothetical protein
MKVFHLALVIILIALSSCCREEPIETASYPLTDKELSLIPYDLGDYIRFNHSNGYEFSFYVSENKVEWKEYHEFCEWFCCPAYYFSYQTKITKLEAAYPKLIIELSLGAPNFGNYSPGQLNVSLNYRHSASLVYDSNMIFNADSLMKSFYYESIEINNRLFTNVIEKYFDTHQFVQDTSILLPKSILYNELGLLQIKMSNNEKYSIVF